MEVNELPVPRLQLRLEYEGQKEGVFDVWAWHYELVYEHLLGHDETIDMGKTTCKGVWQGFGMEDTPFRDGAHIKHDTNHFNIPAYAIRNNIVERIDGFSEAYYHGESSV